MLTVSRPKFPFLFSSFLSHDSILLANFLFEERKHVDDFHSVLFNFVSNFLSLDLLLVFFFTQRQIDILFPIFYLFFYLRPTFGFQLLMSRLR